MTPQHSFNEFHKNANGKRACKLANRKLAELQNGIDDPLWQQQVIKQYLLMLKCGHKMSTEGSLLAEVTQ